MSITSADTKSSRSVSAHLRHFEALLTDDDDPWQVRDTWGERHKRHCVARALGGVRLGLGLELGCGNGIATLLLAPRFVRLLALDGAPKAVRLAQRELEGRGNVDVRQAVLPWAGPRNRFDAVIATEVLYYLPPPLLLVTLRGVYDGLRPGGRFLATQHWRCFKDAECSQTRLLQIARSVFGNEVRRIAGGAWLCHVFRRRPRR